MATADTSLSYQPYSNDPSVPNPLPNGSNNIAAVRDEPDDLFNYDPNIDSIQADINTNNPSNQTLLAQRRDLSPANDLGIDTEIKIRKPRKPVAKLDEDLLLSQRGIPKLRKISKDRLKFKGKGHEFSDVKHLLNTYQLWLDDLFPKAKFMDGAGLIEKLGHKRRIRVMREEWIREAKGQRLWDDGEEGGSEEDREPANQHGSEDADAHEVHGENEGSNDDSIFQRGGASNRPSDSREGGEGEGRMDLDHVGTKATENETTARQTHDVQPEEDELDALLREDAEQQAAQPTAKDAQPPPNDNFGDEDEEAALFDM